MGEVPDAVSPVLQVDVPQTGARGPRRSRSPRSGSPPSVRGSWPFRPSTVASAPSSRITSVCPRSAAAVGQRREHVQRLIDHHAAGDVQQVSARPAGGVQGGELVVVRIRRLPLQQRPQPIAVLQQQPVETAEQHALLRPFADPGGRTAGQLFSAAECRPGRRPVSWHGRQLERRPSRPPASRTGPAGTAGCRCASTLRRGGPATPAAERLPRRPPLSAQPRRLVAATRRGTPANEIVR